MGAYKGRIGRRLFLSASVGLVSAPAIVAAQGDWPSRQIRIVVPYPPGGPSDITTRLVMERAASLLGQSVLFDNRAGASGAIGAEHVKNSPADGYTFLTTTTAMVCITQHLQPLPYDPAKDFVAVARTATSWMGMGINLQVPATTSRSSSPTPRPILARSTSARPAWRPSPSSMARCSTSRPA